VSARRAIFVAPFDELVAEVQAMREESPAPYDVVVTNPADTDPPPWIDAGATWCLTGFSPQPTVAEVEAAIDAGP
jgi:hypothetical protein